MISGVWQWGPNTIVIIVFGGHFGMERLNGAVDEKQIVIISFTERINIGLMSLVRCDFNEVHVVTRDGKNNKLGDNCWETGSI